VFVVVKEVKEKKCHTKKVILKSLPKTIFSIPSIRDKSHKKVSQKDFH